MFGLIIIVIAVAYLLLSIAVVKGARRHARNNGKRVARWGWGAALVMYLIPFWDWLPTVATHQYYCATEAGFWVYKTPEQWKLENPGVMEGLVANKDDPRSEVGDMNNYVTTHHLNSRFNLLVKHNGQFRVNRWRHEQEIIDIKTDVVLAHYVDFSTSQIRRQAGWSGWKLWLDSRDCIDGRNNAISFVRFTEQFKGIER